MIHIFADAAASMLWSKTVMISVTFGMASLALGLIGSAYMNAVGRNPESAKAASQIIIIVAMVEITILLAFLLGAFLLK